MRKLWYRMLSYLAGVVPGRDPEALRAGRTLRGYGRVNWWAAAGKAALRRDLVACAAAGVEIYTIEMAGWAESSVLRNEDRLREACALYAWLVEQCRALGLWLLVSIVNDNAGSGKYGDQCVSLAEAGDALNALAECVRKNGAENVLVQPVAETRTDAGRAFVAHCVAVLNGFTLVNNAGSRPTDPGGMQHFAWHPFKVADIAGAPTGALVVSDTGSIVVELGGSLDGPGNPEKVKAFARAVRSRGCPAAVYYAFMRREHDGGAIEAMGAA